MREIEIGCVIVDKARVIASKKGLDASWVFCPYTHTCTGSDCFLNGIDLKLDTQMDKFYTKLEKYVQRNTAHINL